jgi:hypothetical protein
LFLKILSPPESVITEKSKRLAAEVKTGHRKEQEGMQWLFFSPISMPF